MSIQQSTELIIFVTHVEAEDSFLKIWGQVDKNSATCVERMILPLVERFARSQGCVGPQSANLRINALCCARFQNEGYYRARIINVRADGMVVLQFIDYGNVEVLPPQEIHLLENIPGSESLQSFPPVAFDFTLMHVLPVNGAWENKIVESIKKTLWYNEYKILIHTVVNNHRFIKLWYNNEDFAELLIKRHMATVATLQEMFRPKCVQQSQVPIYQQPSKSVGSNNCTSVTSVQNLNSVHCDGNDMHEFQRNVPLCCSAQQKHIMQTPVQEALVFKSRVLDVGSKHDVYVSFVEDGPYKFSVQVQSTSHILSMLMRDINSHPTEPLQEPPLPGSVCLGRYTQDKVLCRAVVMSVMENKCKLYYVDFGHTEVLSYTDIFQLPPHYINPRVLSIRFTLSGVHELKVTDEMKEYFKQIVSGKLLVLHVRPPEGPPLVQYGDLYDDGKNIKDVLRQAFPSPSVLSPTTSSFAYQEPRKLLKGAEEVVHVSFVESCRKFFVQLDNDNKALDSIMNCLAEFCKSAPTLSLPQLKLGLPCAALYDNQWYRAQILGINADNVKVLYVDYGNEETVTLMSLHLIHEDLVKKLQAQAIKCILNGWELLPSTQDVYNQFELLILEKRLRLRVIDVNPDGIVVDLYEPENMENIKSQMLHITRDDKQLMNESTCKSVENQYNVNTSPKNNQSENTNKWHKKNQLDSWNQSQNDSTGQERNRSKTWKGESYEGKPYENRNEKSNFHRNDSRNDRFNRDDYSNNRNMKDKWNNKNEYNDTNSFKSGKGTRGNRNRTPGFVSKGHSSDKSWSDKDSDTSSRGSSRRGRGGSTRGGYSKREGGSSRMQNNRWNDRDSDGSSKTGKRDSNSYQGNNRFKERKGQGYRITQNKLNVLNSNSEEEEGRRYSPMRNKKQFRIPFPNIVVGTTNTCEVVFTNSPSDFFIQLSSNYAALDSVMENIASEYENGGEPMKDNEISSGVYCIAQYAEDFKWYRAIVKSVNGKNATVQFVDYGNVETVEFYKIKSMQKEFLKLPIQAVRCKLFGIKDDDSDKNKTKVFEDKVNGKSLEAEFVTEEYGIYSVLLREVIEGCPTGTFINEEFCQGIDLLKAKEDAISGKKISGNTKRLIEHDYAPRDARWTTISHMPGTNKHAIVTWFTNPNNFYCQILDNENEFIAMMNEIQKVYVGREPISYALNIGSPVIAIFSDDGALYRAEIIELNKLNGHLIQYIDFGNTAVVEPRKIYPVEKKFMHFPKQAVQCSLLNIVPQDGTSWSKVNTQEIDNCFNADKYECTFHDTKNNLYLISLNNNGIDVANTLVEKSLASFASANKTDVVTTDKNTTAIECNMERMDINLLSGQTLKVKVSNVKSTSKFYVQLPSAAECQNIVNEYMVNKNPEVMHRLSAHEICLGTGCLVYSKGVWRRAVISNHSQSTGFDVMFIDTGVYHAILSDSVLALPGELSVMQNQAVECSLLNVEPSLEADSILTECVEGKEVIMYIDEVDNNRLIVKLFDLLGNRINILEDSDEKISPICPMPILSPTHKVSVTYADHSASIWLQRNVEYTLDKSLIEALDQYYSTSGKLVEPKEGLVCAAKSVDGHWYRSKIIKHTETGVYVKFIDYGNNEEVTFDVLMALDPNFYVPYQLAINVSLPVTLNGTISEQLNILQNYLSNKELTAVFHNVDKKWVVELLYDGEKISDKFRSLNLVSKQEMSSTGQPDIHNMAVGSKYDVYVSHVDSPSQFWLQSVDDATDLSKKQEELQTEALTFPRVNKILEEGSLCVAVYTIDNLWYRAQVLDADEDITTVRFIDYGNTDVINNKSENIRQISDSWKEIKEYAIKCRLDVIPIDSEDWSATACERFENLVTSVESLEASIITNGTPKRVDLLINGKSLSETLVEDQHAIRVHTEEDLIDEIIDLELDPHSAFVSHINSPSEFWVQEEKSVGDLEVMTDRFIVAHMFPKVDEIKENMLCVAKYPEDECWYRARVISHKDNATRVIYIDYGNSAISTEVRAIPADLADVPPLSRKCHLLMPEEITEWSETACSEFIKLAADGATIFLLDVLKEGETSLVKLTLDGKNVTDLLASFCERYPPIIEERLPPLGEENTQNIFISRINSPDDFWIQTESSTADLDTMSDRLQDAPNFLPLNTFEIGTICAAKYLEDGPWYRAKILSHTDNDTKVLYIDYGNASIANELRMLPVDIINVPTLSKRCALQKPDTINSWSSEACKTFEELAAEGETMFQLEILDDTNDPIYVKLNFSGRNVVDILSESMSYDTAEVKEKVNVSTNEGTNETLANYEGNGSDKNLDENTVGNTKETETYYQDEKDVDSSIMKSEQELETFEAQNIDADKTCEDVGDEHQEMKEATDDLHSSSNSVLELTVDEIVQNMNRSIENEVDDEEKSFRSNDSNTIESNENNDTEKITKDLENLVTQDEEKSCSSKDEILQTEIDTKINKDDLEEKDMHQNETSQNTAEEITTNTTDTQNLVPLDNKNTFENPEEEKHNMVNSELQQEVQMHDKQTEKCDSNTNIECCENYNKVDVTESQKSSSEQTVKENTDEAVIKADVPELLKSSSKQSVKENTDEAVIKADVPELQKSSSEQSVKENTDETLIKADVTELQKSSSEQSVKENTDETVIKADATESEKSTSEQSVKDNTDESVIKVDVTESQKSSSEQSVQKNTDETVIKANVTELQKSSSEQSVKENTGETTISNALSKTLTEASANVESNDSLEKCNVKISDKLDTNAAEHEDYSEKENMDGKKSSCPHSSNEANDRKEPLQSEIASKISE